MIRYLKSTLLIILLFSSMLVLTACGGSSKEQRQVQKYIDEVKSRQAMEIEPIPQFEVYQPFKYTAQTLRDPFAVPVVRQSEVQPDLDRPKDELEAFSLDALRMVGTLVQNRKIWALVAVPDDAVYRVTVGAHLGQNFGRVDRINKDALNITETVPDGLGGWKKRQATMTLAD